MRTIIDAPCALTNFCVARRRLNRCPFSCRAVPDSSIRISCATPLRADWRSACWMTSTQSAQITVWRWGRYARVSSAQSRSGNRGRADPPVVGHDGRGRLDGVAAPVRYSQDKSENVAADGARSHKIAVTAFLLKVLFHKCAALTYLDSSTKCAPTGAWEDWRRESFRR